MRWAFWRRNGDGRAGAQEPPEDRRLPDDVGLPIRTPHPPAPADHRDDEPSLPRRRPTTAGSGATPDAGEKHSPRTPEPVAPNVEDDSVDEARLANSGPRIADLVSAVLAGDAPAVAAAMTDPDLISTRTAGAAAAGVLATRLPGLSGVDGAVAFGEDEGELLHAYADLLVERCETRRARVAPGLAREDLMVVAHLAAATALGDAAGEPALLVLPGLPAGSQLVAAALLLAQTTQDGAADPARIPSDVADLFA